MAKRKRKRKPWKVRMGAQMAQTGSGFHNDKRRRRWKQRERRRLDDAVEAATASATREG